MRTVFYILAMWTMGSALLAVTMRNLVHCALALIAFFAGVAGIFLTLHAEFLGAVQIIVYVGAIAVLILFAIMLTRHLTGDRETTPFSNGAIWGWLASFAVLCAILYGLQTLPPIALPEQVPDLSVGDMGRAFMTRFAIPFEVISLLLTAALVGAIVIALEEPKGKR